MSAEPRFKIGDVVFSAESSWGEERVDCPDCLGTRQWTAKLPNGDEFQVPCGTCQFGYESTGRVRVSEHRPRTRRLTVGQIRSEISATGEKYEYMCVETGIGSGSLWSGETLFASEEEARAAATIQAAERTRAAEERNSETRARVRKETLNSWKRDGRLRLVHDLEHAKKRLAEWDKSHKEI